MIRLQVASMTDNASISSGSDRLNDLSDRPGARYEIVFEVLSDEVEAIHRLKALLKRSLRDLRLKCVSIRDTTGEPRR